MPLIMSLFYVLRVIFKVGLSFFDSGGFFHDIKTGQNIKIALDYSIRPL